MPMTNSLPLLHMFVKVGGGKSDYKWSLSDAYGSIKDEFKNSPLYAGEVGLKVPLLR